MTLFLEALKGKNRSGRPPVWLMRQAGRYLPEYRLLREKYDFLELVKNPELIFEVTLQPILRFGMDAAILFSDILMIFKAFDIPFSFIEGTGPRVETPKNLDDLPYIPPEESLSFVKKGILEIKKSSKIPLIGFAGAPFTVISYLIEGGSFKSLAKTKRFMFHEKERFLRLLDKLTEATIDYLNMQIDAGVDALQLFDSWAGYLSYADFMEITLPCYEKISRALQNRGVPFLLFCKGSFPLTQAASSLPFTGFSLDSHVSLNEARKSLPGKLLQGNLDPEILAFAPVDVMQKSLEKILKEMGKDPSYIFNLGHGVLPTTPIEAVERLLAVIRNQ